MRISRSQIRNLARVVDADPSIEVVEVRETETGRLSFYRPAVVETLTRLRLTPTGEVDLDAALHQQVLDADRDGVVA